MGTTSRGFPYPDGDDRVIDGDDAMQALAEAVDTEFDGLPLHFAGGGFPNVCHGVVVMQHGTYNAPFGPIGPFMVRGVGKTGCVVRAMAGNLNGVELSYVAVGS
jgi:hypothetical protein